MNSRNDSITNPLLRYTQMLLLCGGYNTKDMKKKQVLIDFMKWCKNNVPVGTILDAKQIVDEYQKSIESERRNEARNVSENEQTKEVCNCGAIHIRCSCLELGYCLKCGVKLQTDWMRPLWHFH